VAYDDIYLEASDKMEKAIEVFANELKGIRTGRATAGLVENIRAEYYGAPTPLKQLASISIPDPRLIMIKPFDATAVQNVEKAIQKSDLGITPQSDGKVIRLTIPPLSEERRKQLAKMVKEIGEKARVSIRNVRRDALKKGDDEEKSGSITEDDKFKLKDEIKKLTEDSEKKVDEVLARKTEEIMKV
jgi:ribosome recycling factor